MKADTNLMGSLHRKREWYSLQGWYICITAHGLLAEHCTRSCIGDAQVSFSSSASVEKYWIWMNPWRKNRRICVHYLL